MDSTNACEHLCLLQCAKMYPDPILDQNESSTNAPTFLRKNATKHVNPPHIGDLKRCQYCDKAPQWGTWTKFGYRGAAEALKSSDLPTPGKENLETHEKKSGDSTKNSEIVFFFPDQTPFPSCELGISIE